MKTIGQMMVDRIPTDRDLRKMALRDSTDVMLHPELEDLTEKPQVVEHIHRNSNMSSKDFHALEQVILKVDYLEKKLNAKKPRKQYTKYS